MKKLISILLMLMMLLSGMALAEDAAPVEAPTMDEIAELQAEIDALQARLDELTGEATTELAAEATEAESASSEPTNMSLLAKGLIVTAGGLCGVFLVLILFFLMIKVMGKLLK